MNRFFLALLCAAMVFIGGIVFAEDDPIKTNLVWPVATGQNPPWGTILGPAITVRGRVQERVEAWSRVCDGYTDCTPEPLLLDPGPWGCAAGATMEDMTNKKTYAVFFKAAGSSDDGALAALGDVVRQHIANEARYRGLVGDYIPPRFARKVRFVSWFNNAPWCARASGT